MDLKTETEPTAEYCRAIETYLCRKNDGHLIRIVGPSFEMVSAWAARGVPVKVAFRGIDRYFERYYAKGPRRRPVRIDFCEADVLDVFDEWRRAVGISSIAAGPGPSNGADVDANPDCDADGETRRPSLPAHLERVVSRLSGLRSTSPDALGVLIESVVGELDAVRENARNLRGAARAQLLARLSDLDAQLMAAARERLTADARAELRRDAEAELAPFRARMPQTAYEQSLAACMDRLLREHVRLPILTLE